MNVLDFPSLWDTAKEQKAIRFLAGLSSLGACRWTRITTISNLCKPKVCASANLHVLTIVALFTVASLAYTGTACGGKAAGPPDPSSCHARCSQREPAMGMMHIQGCKLRLRSLPRLHLFLICCQGFKLLQKHRMGLAPQNCQSPI